MSSIDSKSLCPTPNPQMFNLLPITLKSGVAGAYVTFMVAGSIYKKDMIQTNQRFFRADSLKASFLFSASNLPKVGIQIPLYHLFKSFTPHHNTLNDIMCSGAAGLLAAPVYTPFEHVALQYHRNHQKESLKKIFTALLTNNRLQQGLAATAIRDFKFSCIYNSAAPLLSRQVNKQMQGTNLNKNERELISILFASLFVGSLGGILQTPSDVLRAKRQIASLQDAKPLSYMQTAKSLGFKGLFTSWHVKALIGARVVPILALAERYFINPPKYSMQCD